MFLIDNSNPHNFDFFILKIGQVIMKLIIVVTLCALTLLCLKRETPTYSPTVRQCAYDHVFTQKGLLRLNQTGCPIIYMNYFLNRPLKEYRNLICEDAINS